ncbi:hypothetical protein DPMN_083629 [Dreissena polymorpha]|uniref:Uncharacterized protein n=1 Tax=Dreissena polymorpha TaxID=45954 RepID=A0A9D3YCT7_DREPO|nr:hypothetical protein DPMN_083629 [Dreissena polymorpha]
MGNKQCKCADENFLVEYKDDANQVIGVRCLKCEAEWLKYTSITIYMRENNTCECSGACLANIDDVDKQELFSVRCALCRKDRLLKKYLPCKNNYNNCSQKYTSITIYSRDEECGCADTSSLTHDHKDNKTLIEVRCVECGKDWLVYESTSDDQMKLYKGHQFYRRKPMYIEKPKASEVPVDITQIKKDDISKLKAGDPFHGSGYFIGTMLLF